MKTYSMFLIFWYLSTLIDILIGKRATFVYFLPQFNISCINPIFSDKFKHKHCKCNMMNVCNVDKTAFEFHSLYSFVPVVNFTPHQYDLIT